MLTSEAFGLSVTHHRRGAEALLRWTVKELRQNVSRAHPLQFGPAYFPELYPNDFCDMHWEMTDMYLSSARAAVAAPVALGKTTVITKTCALYSMFCDDDVKDILVVSNTSDLSNLWIEDMGNRCKRSQALHDDYGNFEGPSWSKEHLEFIFPHKRGFIRGIGREVAIRGRRPDIIIIDDPQDEAAVKYEEPRRTFKQWFWGPLVGRLGLKTGKLYYVGTCFDPMAFLVEIIQKPPKGWVTKSFAMFDEIAQKSNWEAGFPTDLLLRRKDEIGEEAFQREYQNNPVILSAAVVFDLKKLREIERIVLQSDRVSICVDPSFAVGGDPWAFSVVEIDSQGMWHVREAHSEASGTDRMMKGIEYLARKYSHMAVMGIETQGQGKVMEHLVNDLKRRTGLSFPVEFISHPRTKGSKGKRIEAFARFVNQGRVTLNPGLRLLKDEIRNYISTRDGQRDDILDTLAMHLETNPARRPVSREPITERERIHKRYEELTRLVPQAKEKGWEAYL